MKTKALLFLASLVISSGSTTALGETSLERPNWDRGMAMEVIESTQTMPLITPLFQLAREGDDTALLASLAAIQNDSSLSAPAADYVIFTFTAGLSDLNSNSVSPEVLSALSLYEPKTRVAHDDNPQAGVPLFNVRAAAAGVQNSWERQSAAERAVDINQPGQWIDDYLATNAAGRRGFEDVLITLSDEQRQSLGEMAAGKLPLHPDLITLTAKAGLQDRDIELIWRAIEHGQSSELPAVLRATSQTFSAEECGQLLHRSLELESVTRKSLTIAQLGPVSLGDERSRDVLFSALENRELGAGAALVLSASPDPQIQNRLSDIAENQEGLAKHRATLAISLRETEARAAQ